MAPVLMFLDTATFTHVSVFTLSGVAIVVSDLPAPNASLPELLTPKPQSLAPPPHSEAMMNIVV